MAKLSDLRPGQKVVFSPIQDKTKKLTGEILNYVFLAVIQTSEGTAYAHSDDIDVLEQPKPTLSEELKNAIAEQVKAAIATPSAPPAAAPVAEWEEAPAESSTEVKQESGATQEPENKGEGS